MRRGGKITTDAERMDRADRHMQPDAVIHFVRMDPPIWYALLARAVAALAASTPN